MRFRSLGRLAFIFLGIYLVFLGGGAYYGLILPIRIFHHMLLTILLALWLIARIRRGQGLPQTPLNGPIYAAVIVWVASAALSIDPRMAFEHLWFQFIHVMFFFVLVDFLQRGRERLVMETQFMLAAAVIFLSGLELVSWYFGLGFIPGTEVGWADVIGPGAWLPLQSPGLALAMSVSTLLAGYVAPLVTITGVWAWTTTRRDFRVVLTIMAATLLVFLLLTDSRGGLLSLLTALGFVTVVRLGQHSRMLAIAPAPVLYGMALALGVIAAILFMLSSLNPARSVGDAGRVDMWTSAVRMTGDHALLGVGPGLFGRAFRGYRNPAIAQDKLASAHNAYLNTAAETGLAGAVVSLWLGIAFIRAWYRNWKDETTHSGRRRLEGMFAALLGVGVHSLVDVFTVTPIVLLILLLVAYCIRRPATSSTRRWTAIVTLGIVVVYGVWLIQLDRAQLAYQRSLRGGEMALADAQMAAAIDPALNLYDLQVAHILGQQVLAGDVVELNAATDAYLNAVELEPTWDTGWMNLAALAERAGDLENAIVYVDIARNINYLNVASLHYARLVEIAGVEPPDRIIDAYTQGMRYDYTLPLSSFWTETELRREAVMRYADTLDIDLQYRILAVHDPDRAAALVPEPPVTAAEWWIIGENALTNENDPEAAITAFNRAIDRAPLVGDYYVSRARAELHLDPVAAERDLNIAQLLGTRYEYLNAVRAQLAATPEARVRLLANALPPRVVLQEFAAVLYGRSVALFDVLPEMRPVGPGRAAMQPWYELAEERATAGDLEGARQVYRAILDYAPYEVEARERLLSSGATGQIHLF